jgi:hypothetical protein
VSVQGSAPGALAGLRAAQRCTGASVGSATPALGAWAVTNPDVICHGLTGEDVTQLVRGAVRVPVKSLFKITPFGRSCVPGQLALEVRAPLAGRLPAGCLDACDEYAGGKSHVRS